MVNTLDSMIGYRDEQYKRFGWFAARLDDAANFIPARISAIVISLAAPVVKRSSMRTIKTALRDGRKHLSPNAGIPEAAFAGALGIRLGGPSIYGGHLVEKPYIGQETHPVQIEDIRTATTLMIISAFIWLIVCWALLIA
jgi:adenosylcobinamide-phosphate synthase